MKKATIELKDNQEFKEVSENTFQIFEVKEKWPKNNDEYFYMAGDGEIIKDLYQQHKADLKRMKIGNFFKTEKEAEESFPYFVINSEWDYWHVGMNKPAPELDECVEVEVHYCGNWETGFEWGPFLGEALYRYKRKKYTVE